METRTETDNRLRAASFAEAVRIPDMLGTPVSGHTSRSAERMRSREGGNELVKKRSDGLPAILRRAFFNPFSVVLMTIALITWLIGFLPAEKAASSPAGLPIMVLMIVTSAVVRLYEEMKAKRTAEGLEKMADIRIRAMRDGRETEIDPEDLVVGDLVMLESGDMVPADIRISSASFCMVSESMLTGESGVRLKKSEALTREPRSIREMDNMLFRGSVITSGSARGYVIRCGESTAYGSIASGRAKMKNGFDRGANSVAWVLIKFMAILVPIVFVISGITKDSWVSAFLFALSAAVGLTPELLPMVMTACLARGTSRMGRKETIVKDMNATETLASMDTLCVDKTGTLTNDSFVLEYWLDVIGNESGLTLDLAWLSVLADGRPLDHIERAIRETEGMEMRKERCAFLRKEMEVVSDRPFDYERRISSAVIRGGKDSFIVVKGSPKDVVSRCSSVYWNGRREETGSDSYESVRAVTRDMSEDGLKVIAIAAKRTEPGPVRDEDERDLALIGYVTFLDAPKKGAMDALDRLERENVRIKVLTGDGLEEARSTSSRLGIDTTCSIRGSDLFEMDEDSAHLACERCTVFSDLTPKMKAEIVEMLRANGHTVGFLGDGMNDLPAVLSSDVGISVENASEALRESADVILLRKDLSVVSEGIEEGRKSFLNMQKYIKITASSNLGNIAAVVIAGLFLPFFPMTSVQLLLLNLLYDMLCLCIPWDSVDDEQITHPLEWSARTLPSFMLFFGPISTLFDVLTFSFLMFFLCPLVAGGAWSTLTESSRLLFVSVFQTGWFLESMWSQVLILHLLRTEKIPYKESRPSKVVTAVTVLGLIVLTLFSSSQAGNALGMTRLPGIYFVFLIPLVALYMVTVTLMKRIYMKSRGRLI